MIFVACGMPRSGSLLQYNLARVMLELAGERVVGMDALEPCEAPPEWTEAAASCVWHLVHSHELGHLRALFRGVPEPFLPWGGVVLGHTFRDLRDVLASLARFYDKPPAEVLPDLAENVKRHEMLSVWRDEPWMLFQQYEEMRVYPEGAARRVALHLHSNGAFLRQRWSGASLSEIVRRAAELCSVEAVVRRQERLLAAVGDRLVNGTLPVALVNEAHRESPAEQDRRGLRDLKHRTFWHHVGERRGEPGAWRDALSAEDVAAVERVAGRYMRTEGYV